MSATAKLKHNNHKEHGLLTGDCVNPAPSRRRYKIVSLFSGCGGMDLGFLGGFKFHGKNYSRLPFEIIWANDLNKAACETYKANLAHDIYCGSIYDYLVKLPKRTDILIGGFPCQDVSINGKLAADKGKKTTLYKAMIESISKTKPKIFIAENVKGILMEHSKALYSEMIRGFAALGYNVSAQVYLSANYDVPQMRERVMFVGVRKGAPAFEHPLPVAPQSKWITAHEAIGDLETVSEEKDFSHIWSKAKVSPEQGERRLLSDRPSTTIRAECHGNIQFHYSQPRRISLREAARLQSFPDAFTFTSGMRETERQIGNAVPPVLAWHVARAVQNYLT